MFIYAFAVLLFVVIVFVRKLFVTFWRLLITTDAGVGSECETLSVYFKILSAFLYL